MGAMNKIGLAWDVGVSRLFGMRKPVVVAWSVTNQCNRTCKYCDSPLLDQSFIQKDDGLRILEQIRKAGGRIVSFTGGEPLVHPFIGEYIEKAHSLGMQCGLNSNGVLVRKKIDMIKDVRFIKMSLDGEPSLHDEIRGGKCAQYVFDALDVCKEFGITATLLTVLTNMNLDQIPYLLSTAQKHGITVFFQPATGHALKSERDNPISPELSQYRKCLDQIIEAKKGRYSKFIGNSLPGLRHLRHWPDPVRMKCEGIRVSARVEPDGRVYHCGRMIRYMKGPDAVKIGFEEAFKRLRKAECDFCWCAHRVETNLILGLHPSAVIEALRAKLF